MKRILILFTAIIITCNCVLANDFKMYYDNGQNFYNSSQYTNAINEFKKALRINYKDNSARIGLVNSYLARGTYYATNSNDYEKAANDFRSALFYLKYYPEAQDVQNSITAIQTTIDNLEQCMNALEESRLPQERYNRGVVLRKNGNLPAAGYEFLQVISSDNKELKSNAYAQIGDIMAVLDNTPKAELYYKQAVALNSNNTSVRLKYARVLDKLGKDNLSVNEYNYVLSKGEANSEVLYALEKIYTKKLTSSPNNAELNSNLGAILQKEGKLDEALKYYQTAEKLNPSSITIRLNIGTLYQQKKDYASALSAYNSILALEPNNIEANMYKAQLLAESGEKSEALKVYKNILTLKPDFTEAKTEMIDLMKDTMTPEQILLSLSNNNVADKSSVDAMYNYAKTLHNDNKLDNAITCYDLVLKYNTTNPEVYENLALAYLDKKDYTNAEKIIKTAQSKFPNSEHIKSAANKINNVLSNAKYTDANKYFTSGDYQKALDVYLSISPKQKDVLIAIAACYKGLNNIDKSIEYYKKALSLDSTDSEIAYYIGVLYAEKESWTSSKIYLQKALALNPKNTEANDLLSTVIEQNNVILIDKVINMYNSKDYTNALKLISQILSEDKTNSYAYYYRGLIYDAQQKPLEAVEEYKKAVNYNSELSISYYLIATAYDTLGQYSNAYIYFNKFVNTSKTNDEYKKYSITRLNDLKSYAKHAQ